MARQGLTRFVSAAQVVSVVTLANTTGMGGFYTDGFNGVINGAQGLGFDVLAVQALGLT